MEAQQATNEAQTGENLSGLARSLQKGAFFDCEFEQLASNRAIVHFPKHLRLEDMERALSSLRDHIAVTHIDPSTVHLQTDHPTFADN